MEVGAAHGFRVRGGQGELRGGLGVGGSDPDAATRRGKPPPASRLQSHRKAAAQTAPRRPRRACALP